MNKNILAQELKDFLLNNDYNMVEKIFQKLSFEDISSVVISVTYDTEDISIYTFIVSLLLKNEIVELHSLAANLFALSFSYLEGGYASGLYHAKKCVELAPDNVDYKQFLLLFNVIPERLVSKEEALQIAREILEIDPNNKVALEIIGEKA